MDELKIITKNTLERLKENRLPTTPENYFIEFKNQAKIINKNFDEISILNKALTLLTTEEKNSLSKESMCQIVNILIQRVTSEDLRILIGALSGLLLPTINFDFKEEIDSFILENLQNPKNIVSEYAIEKIKELAKRKTEADKKVLGEKTKDIIKLTSLISRYYDKTLADNNISNDDVKKIKEEIVALEISGYSKRELVTIQKKLVEAIYKLEDSIFENNKALSASIGKFKLLNKQIEDLEKELRTVKEEYLYDYLTNLFNRRAYEIEAKKMEKQFLLFNTDFAIVFLDIDHFKKINDNYGHPCGDEILRSFADVLKDLTRKEDVVSRYGGEEFIALINFQNKIEVKRYINRIKNAFVNNTFIYNGHKIDITFSAGVAYRANYKSVKDSHIKADELLYQAKQEGRNKVIFDDGTIL